MHTVLPCRKLQNGLIVAGENKTMLIHYAIICSEGKKYLKKKLCELQQHIRKKMLDMAILPLGFSGLEREF